MIEKITNQNQIARHKLAEKINELVDVVNQLVSCEQARTCYELIHKNEEPADPYAEQRQWIGKLCWFWNEDTEEDKRCKVLSGIRLGDDYKYYDCDCIKWEHCEPVKPDDNIIYKGE